MASKFNWQGFFIRFVAALALVFATYNAERLSYFHWLLGDRDAQAWALKAFVGGCC